METDFTVFFIGYASWNLSVIQVHHGGWCGSQRTRPLTSRSHCSGFDTPEKTVGCQFKSLLETQSCSLFSLKGGVILCGRRAAFTASSEGHAGVKVAFVAWEPDILVWRSHLNFNRMHFPFFFILKRHCFKGFYRTMAVFSHHIEAKHR